ncbi:WD repeat-containing protein jip5 [Nothophoma quercina]|uniref:WD repeat-containing protein jip5 n=1 Tax=Nothophoma quercina TaxID=749835 RepID=A0ABR3R7H1_9PLEO
MSSMTPGVPLKKGFRAGGILQTGNRFEQEHNQLILIGQVFSKIAFMTSPAQKYSLNAALGGRIQDIFEMLMIALNELAKYLKQNPTETLNSFFYCVTMQTGSLKSIKRDDPESRDLANDFVLFRTLFARIMEYDKIESHAQHKVTFSAFPEDDFAFIRRVGFYLGGRCFCVTSDNQIGLVPERAQVGDSVAIVEGAPVPFVLREASESVVENEKAYRIVGDAYVHGVMRGELVGLTKKKESGLRRLFGSSKKKIEFEWSKMLLL